jgi:hypothetical protein
MEDRRLGIGLRLTALAGVAGIVVGIFVPYASGGAKVLLVNSTDGFRVTIPDAITPFAVVIAAAVLALVPSAGRRVGAALAGLGGVTAVFFLGVVLRVVVVPYGSFHYLRAGGFVGLVGGVLLLVVGMVALSAGQQARRPAAVAAVVSQVAPPGWYPDPSGQARERYWDGQVWTAGIR